MAENAWCAAVGPIAADHPEPLEALDPLGDGRGREADPAPELGEGDAGVELELGQDPAVRGVQNSILGV